MKWEGFEQEEGIFEGHEYGIVWPKKVTRGIPYVWRTEFFGAFPSVDLAMLEKGYAVVYYRISDLYGASEAVSKMAVFQTFVEEKYALAAKPVLFGFSRGGLYALHYTASYPKRVGSLYLDAPVIDIYSWPAGAYTGIGAKKEWEECKALWNISHEAYREQVDQGIQTLLRNKIPLVIVAGEKDEVVPYEENGAILQKAYANTKVPFAIYMKPECGHHPHSLENPEPVVTFLVDNRPFPTVGNSYRINDHNMIDKKGVLFVHDQANVVLGIALEQGLRNFCPFAYIGTSAWMGNQTNDSILGFDEELNLKIYELLLNQGEIGLVLYALAEGHYDKESLQRLDTFIKHKCPEAKFITCAHQEEAEGLIQYIKATIGEMDQPKYKEYTEREWAEWTNFCITEPTTQQDKRILLVGDSISNGYGAFVQRLMPDYRIDRLSTSEGTDHPNFFRMLQIALEQYDYELIHMNNGIHVHGVTPEEYKQNLKRIFQWIHLISPRTQIIFCNTTPFSKKVAVQDQEVAIEGKHFKMGDRVPLQEGIGEQDYWVFDNESSEGIIAFNQMAMQICKKMHIPVNNLFEVCVNENLQKSDGVHFQQSGYKRLAECVVQSIVNYWGEV